MTYQQPPRDEPQQQFQPQYSVQSPPQQTPPYQSDSRRQAHRPTSGLAIAGLVLGIIGAVLCWIPIVNNVAAVLGVVGLILAVFGIVVTGEKHRKSGRGLAIAGAVLSVIAIVVTLVSQAAFGKAMDAVADGGSHDEPAAVESPGSVSEAGPSSAPAAKPGSGKIGDYAVSIDSAERGPADYEGKPTVFVTYTWTNGGTDNQMMSVALPTSVFQDGVELDTAITFEKDPEGYDSGASLKEIQPGAQQTLKIGYVLKKETGKVEVEVHGFLIDGEVSRSFSL